MDTKQQHKVKNLIFILFILAGLYLLTNTNNNPNAIVQRIFRPINVGTGTIYYAVLIPLLIIYYSIKELYKHNNFAFLNTGLRRFVILVLIVSTLPASCSEFGVKLYKSYYNDLNAVYCYRNNIDLHIETIENKPQLVCKLDLENCSTKSVDFYVKVRFPSYLRDVKEKTLVNTNHLIVLGPKERRPFEITFLESSVNSGSLTFTSNKGFEFTLYNTLQEVKFIKEYYP